MKKLLLTFFIILGVSISINVKAGASDNVWGWAWSENIGWISMNSTNTLGAIVEGNDLSGWAWSDNIGWVSLNCATDPGCSKTTEDYKVHIGADGVLSGYAWSDNIGWVSFNRAETGIPPQSPYNGSETFVAKYDSATREIYGWARFLSYTSGWDGWVSFNNGTYGVSINTSGKLTGWAWGSDVVGWLQFSPDWSSVTNVDYGVNINADTGAFSGYAWSENIGWINFAPGGTYPASPDYSAKVNLQSGQVSGWARACSVFETGCTGILKSDLSRGGWEGWLKLRGADYGVRILENGDFEGWAWGGEDPPEEAVVGWVSFNCKNCEGNANCDKQAVCDGDHKDYKVKTSLSFNQKPDQPNKVGDGEVWYHCSFKGKSIPTFSWTYSDPNSDPQAGYEIEVDDDSSFAAPKFNHLVGTAGTSYTLDLSQDDNHDWLSALAWNTTYFWRVRVKDNQGNWSDWSNSDNSKTPKHAYPYPDFTHQPSSPSVGEVITFTDKSTCYDSDNNPYSCKTNPANLYEWDFDNNGSIDSTQRGDATTTYPDAVSYTVKLYITDDLGKCDSIGDTPINTQLPLPEYKEAPPIIWLKKAFLAILNFFSF